MRRRLLAIISCGLMVGANSTQALPLPQDQPRAPEPPAEDAPIDWTLTEVPDRKAILATADFNNGLILATRCVDGVFEATVHGLPEARGMTREIDISLHDHASFVSQWIVGSNKTAAFSRVPVRFARGLAKGGVLQLRVSGAQGRPATRYILDLPPSVSAVEQTLAACNKSMVDLRYDSLEDETPSGLPQGLAWRTRPNPDFPSPPGQIMSKMGFVTLSCGVSAALRPEDCLIESEYPAGFGFGQAVLRAMPRSQLELTNPNLPLRSHSTILFNINFRMD